MLTAKQMRTLPDFFNAIPDPRRTEGRRHRLAVVLGIAAGATLCGMGKGPETQGPGTLRVPSQKQEVRCSQRVHHP